MKKLILSDTIFKILLVSLSLILFSSLVKGANEDLFREANKLLKTQEYEKAAQRYELIEPKSAELNYNLGYAYAKLGKLGIALACFRRAERDFGIFDKWKATEAINHFMAKQKDVSSELSFCITAKKYFFSFISKIPLLYLQIIFLLVWILFLIYCFYLYKGGAKQLIILLFAITFLFGILLISRYKQLYLKQGVVIVASAQINTGPDSTYQTISNLAETKEVVVKKESGSYYKIKFDGHNGWTLKSKIELI